VGESLPLSLSSSLQKLPGLFEPSCQGEAGKQATSFSFLLSVNPGPPWGRGWRFVIKRLPDLPAAALFLVQDTQESASHCFVLGTERKLCWRNLAQVMLTVCAGDPRLIPVPAGLAPDGGHMALDEALGALVPHQGIDLIPVLLLPEGSGMLHHRRVSAGH
jgi:hypothetical protein